MPKIKTIHLVAITIMFLLFIIIVLPRAASNLEDVVGAVDSPDTAFVYTKDELYEMADSFGEDGRSFYIKQRFTFDLVFPLVYGAFMIAYASYGVINIDLKRLFLYIPILAVGFDLLENIFASLVFHYYPREIIIGYFTPYVSLFKWIFVIIGMGIPVIVLIQIIRKKVR